MTTVVVKQHARHVSRLSSELGISELHVVEPVLMSCCVLEMMYSRYMELDIEDIAEQ